MSKYALALDFGNGGGRALFLDLESGYSFSAYQSWSYYSPDGDGFKTEFNASEFFNVFCNLVNGIIYQHKINPDNVVGISVTSMRHACVFLDKDGKEVYAGPNVDTRGLFYQDVIEENTPDVAKNCSGYDLRETLRDGFFDINKIIVGSEGTLAIIVEALLNLAPVPIAKRSAMLFFETLENLKYRQVEME